MSRPLRLEFEGALYHVTSRGNRREPIVGDDADRQAWLAVLEQGLERFDSSSRRGQVLPFASPPHMLHPCPAPSVWNSKAPSTT